MVSPTTNATKWGQMRSNKVIKMKIIFEDLIENFNSGYFPENKVIIQNPK